MVAPCRRFTHQPILALKFLSGYVHRSTLPQSRVRSTAPSGREPGMAGAIQRTARKPEGCGRFSSPLRNSEVGTFHHSTGYTPSVSLRSTAPSEREPGGGAYHSMCRSESGRLRAIFIAPTKAQNILPLKNLPVSAGGAIPGGAGHPRIGTRPKRN